MQYTLVKNSQFEELVKSLELSSLRENDLLSQFDDKKMENNTLFRTFNFIIQRWIQKVKSE
jgi:hypothetical protein